MRWLWRTFNLPWSHFSKTWFYHIWDLRRIRLFLDHSTAVVIATLLVHFKLDTAIPSKFVKSELNRLWSIQNSLARVVANTRRRDHITVTWCGPCTGWKFMNASMTMSSQSPATFSRHQNPHTFLVCSLFNQLALPNYLSSSLCIHHQSRQTEQSSITPSATQLPDCGIPCQHISVYQRLSTHQEKISSPDPPFCKN